MNMIASIVDYLLYIASSVIVFQFVMSILIAFNVKFLREAYPAAARE